MQRISITNPQNIIDGTAKKYYFKLRNTGGPKGDKGDKGDTGQTGPQGPKGDAATVAIGSTTTLAVGQDATVENVGSIYNAVLNFGIPQGPQGPQGAKGDKGDTGAQGETGPRGPQGEKGTNATVYIGTTSTLNPGSQATVYNSGTDSNAVLNFGIPKGEKGDTGPMPTIAQTTGQSTTEVMSQKATTDALNTKQATIDSSHKLSADLVDDTSTANKFVTAQDKTNWNAKQDALTAGNNIDITGTTISTSAIAPEVVAELPATGAEGKLYLTPKNYTRGTGTGNPIEATITDEAGKMDSFKLDGDTYQQTYTGKNLVGFGTYSYEKSGITCTTSPDGTITLNGTRTGSTSGAIIFGANSPKFNLSGTFTMTVIILSGSFSGANIGYNATDANGTQQFYQGYGSNGTYNQGTLTPAQERLDATTGVNILIGSGASTFDNLKFKIQVVAGENHDSDYEPYVGGVPSPNPDYPQPIQTVTGEQTVSINGTDYPLDLGTIELCKIGTYQDYIWKDGEDWKVHKAVGKSNLKTDCTDWQVLNTNTTAEKRYAVLVEQTDIPSTDPSTATKPLFANTLGMVSRIDTYNRVQGIANCPANQLLEQSFCMYIQSISDSSTATVDTIKSWLQNNETVVYYQSTTPTDTTITDTDLIAQLEAIRTASLENGTNTITNTAAGSNLAGDMEVGYYGYNPTNRYDKFIWLDLNNNYEQIGS